MTTQNPLKILILTFEGDMAGSTNSISYLAKGLAKRGHHVYVGIRREALLWDLLEDSLVKRIPMTFKGKFDRENWRQIKKHVQEEGIQIINAQSSKDRYTSLFAKWFYGLKVKIIHTRRQMPMSSGGPLQLYLYNKKTDGIVAVSQQVARGLEKLGIKKDHLKVIYNGTPKEKYEHIDRQLTDQLRADLKISEDDFVIGSVSRMKNQIQIIHALSLLKEPVTAIFCGIEETEEINEVIKGYKVPHQIHFIGHVPSDKILSYYPLFDIKILASTMEGLSQSLLEAMAMGVPVIATAFAGNLDLIQDGKNGLLFEDGDFETLSNLIEKLRMGTNLSAQLKRAGKQTALEKFSIENTLNNYETYFYEILNQ